jgi:histidyl-tRNA synthetase
MTQVSIPQGTRDFSPDVMAKRQFILKSIQTIYQSFGFMPLETPAMENLSTLTGKYGNEGDQLLFKILNNGDFLKKVDLNQVNSSKEILPLIADRGLRYDLTVPLARFVVMNRNDVIFPFKRYQIQPVWRADRPQKGRYREFWQCDADVLGTDSLLCEADFIRIYHLVFENLGLKEYEIKINHRKLLEAVCEMADASEHFKSITVSIDKLDKIGKDGVLKELITIGLTEQNANQILDFLETLAFNQTSLQNLKERTQGNALAEIAIRELEQILDYCNGMNHNVFLDLSLARGLDYYTGAIFEVKALNVGIGSISGGGRYDNLTGVFGMKDVSGIGISFGIDRIYDVMTELSLFPETTKNFTDVLFCPMDDAFISYCIPLSDELRNKGLKTEIYPNAVKLKKQLDYANNKSIQWAIIVGENEAKENKVSIKNLISGDQQIIGSELISNFLLNGY